MIPVVDKRLRRAFSDAAKFARRGGAQRGAGSMVLRDYQVSGVRDILDWATTRPDGRLLFVVPPGGGKTLIVATTLRLLVAVGLKILVVAHRREIIGQHYDHLIACGMDPSMVGVIMGSDERSNPDAFVQIASIDTLNRRRNRWPDVQVVVTDEAHHDASDTRRRLRAHYGHAFRLGITATPHRLDGRGLAADFDEMIVGSTMSALIAARYLATPRTFTVPEELLPDVRRVPISRGDYELVALSRAVCRRNLIGGIVEHQQRLATDLATIVFAASIQHSKLIAKAFRAAGVLAEHLDGDVAPGDRDAMLAAFDRGLLQIISCCNILAEGWDSGRCKCIVQARPTMSLNLHIQQVARCIRCWKGVVPVVLDHAGNALVHGLAHADQSWVLEEPLSGLAPRKAAVKVCPNPRCCALLPTSCKTCPECGTTILEKERVPEEIPGKLREYVPTRADMNVDLERIRQFAQGKGLSEDWVQKVFAAKYDRYKEAV